MFLKDERGVRTPFCKCLCKPCPTGTKLCPTDQLCIDDEKWCDGVMNCHDDEANCTTVETTTEQSKSLRISF